MNNLEELEYFNSLLDIYGALLSSTQKDILEDYYSLNLSLGEISNNRNVTRSAVLDALNKGKKHLQECEDKLHLLAQKQKEIELLEKYKNDKDEKSLLNLERIIKDGI